ncbi:gliding motility lipoprotein GldB [Aquimarina sp. D1M17]|uniref:gliding motility lipoprotein GldB n=1 Tax=Aquimarina acroporae TaxID=2937283 RepID=UPI0020C0EAE1|nr:gliding motility lipoprotein GldB [Aquimarina acroporae]MCK8522244.1 gliding motility lipoprotein GldB [Aquimarina acroporae]
MKNTIGYLKIIAFFCFLCSCSTESKIEKEIAKVPVTVKVERFDRLFAELNAENLQQLKKGYPFLFAEKYTDSVWVAKSKDTIQQELNEEVTKSFYDLSSEEEQLHSFFQHVKYYFPEIKEPRVVAITSDVDYRNKVVLSKGLLIISLDTYLGKDHHFYEGIQKYLRQNFERHQIIPDIAGAYAKNMVGPIRERTFLGNLIGFGKEMYVKGLLIPSISEAQRFGYTEEQYNWVKDNEAEIWRYFIDKQLLYSTDSNLMPRFLYPAPFSKFYLEEIDKEAPDRVGQYIGWKIVSAYMKNNSVSLRQLLLEDSEKIFNTSKYKPAK